MRALASLLLAASLTASLTACGSGDDDPTLTAPTDGATSVAPSSAPSSAASGGLTVSGRDYGFVGLAGFAPKAGSTVPFTFKNISEDSGHDFVVTAPDGTMAGGVDEVEPGASATGTLTFTKPGTYTFVCTVGDHERKGMKGTFTVS